MDYPHNAKINNPHNAKIPKIYVILRNSCLSIKFQFLLSMWPAKYLEAFPAITVA